MEFSQTTSKELTSYADEKKLKLKEYNRLKQKEYRLKQKSLKPKKLASPFQQTKTQQLLKLLVNHYSFVPVPSKLKHPIIKN
jgi:diketogulonate reductase-like aldo/keto reductase